MADPLPPGQEIVVSRYERSDRPALIAFRREHYGEGSAQADPAYVDWQFHEAPGIPGEGAPLHVAWKDGRIVGTMGTIRTALHIQGRAAPAAWVVDFAVRRDLRRSGIGEALSVASRRDAGIRLVIDATPATRGIISRTGYQRIGDVPLFVRPLDLRLCSRTFGLPPPLAWLSAAASPAFAALDARALRFARREGLELVEIAAFDGRADVLFAALSQRYPVLCRRDRGWLEWRFQRYPRAGRYRQYWLARGGEMAGYAILRGGMHHGLPAGILVDYLSPPELLPALLGLCIERFRAAGAAVVRCLQLNALAGRAFGKLGFFRRWSGWQLMARPESPATGELFLDPGSWFLTAGDSNVDRERDPIHGGGEGPNPLNL